MLLRGGWTGKRGKQTGTLGICSKRTQQTHKDFRQLHLEPGASRGAAEACSRHGRIPKLGFILSSPKSKRRHGDERASISSPPEVKCSFPPRIKEAVATAHTRLDKRREREENKELRRRRLTGGDVSEAYH